MSPKGRGGAKFVGMKAFKKDLKKDAKRMAKEGHKANRKIATWWFTDLVRITPKDTNFMASKWAHTINIKPPNKPINNPRGGSHTPASAPRFMTFKMGDTLYLYNPVAYAQRIENGWSLKAPRNFVKNSARRADRRLQREYNRIK